MGVVVSGYGSLCSVQALWILCESVHYLEPLVILTPFSMARLDPLLPAEVSLLASDLREPLHEIQTGSHPEPAFSPPFCIPDIRGFFLYPYIPSHILPMVQYLCTYHSSV